MSQRGGGDTSAAAAAPFPAATPTATACPPLPGPPGPCPAVPHLTPGHPCLAPLLTSPSSAPGPFPHLPCPTCFYLFWISRLPPHPVLLSAPPHVGSAPLSPHRAPIGPPRRLLYLCIARVRAEGACNRPQPQPWIFYSDFSFLFSFLFLVLFCFLKKPFFKLFLGL